MTSPAVEPRWPAAVALIAVGGLWLALPAELSLGPGWLLLVVVIVLLLPIIFTHYRGYHSLNRTLSLVANAVITIALVSSLIFLVQGLPTHRETPAALLRAAGCLWTTNVLVFALWYWRLDAGGPHGREREQGILDSSFLFPQMLKPGVGPSKTPRTTTGHPTSSTISFWRSIPARPSRRPTPLSSRAGQSSP